MARVREQAFTLVQLPAMSRRRRRAFTLVELLVVVSIIALLVTMLTPSLSRGIELARRASCKGRLRQIARACGQYTQAKRLHRGQLARALPNSGPTSSNWHDGGSANRESLQLLVRHGFLSPDSLICPSVDDDQLDTLDNGDRSAYAFISMVRTPLTLDNLPSATVIAADRNPMFDPNSKSPNSGMSHKNSLSHKTSGLPPEGQSVVRADESVHWITLPQAVTGTNSQDWIYEPRLGSASDGTSTDINDVYLLN